MLLEWWWKLGLDMNIFFTFTSLNPGVEANVCTADFELREWKEADVDGAAQCKEQFCYIAMGGVANRNFIMRVNLIPPHPTISLNATWLTKTQLRKLNRYMIVNASVIPQQLNIHGCTASDTSEIPYPCQ
ncbi:hypothetical protein CPB83DRAFT_836485 [Crepidotus variabilis]|uniref:Uncharacterized protein n=1 Tax=Crepidotus variabilis TaxID=179855 RepID=A0A9P6EDM7_9AGAR|nr:hypothetical protein CPB83DRAFT_836485 [Crepidotus variabilis]